MLYEYNFKLFMPFFNVTSYTNNKITRKRKQTKTEKNHQKLH